MSFVTYILLVGVMLGTQNRFSPEQLSLTSSSLLAWLLVEVGLVWLSLYVLGVTSDLRWLDIVALLGYKYVRWIYHPAPSLLALLYVSYSSMIMCIGAALLAGSQLYYIVLTYLSITSTYFMVSLLSYHMLYLPVFCLLDTILEIVIAAQHRKLSRW